MDICIRWNDDLKNVKVRFFRYTNFLSCFPKRFISIDRRYDESSTIVRKLEGTFSLFIRSIVPVWGILRSFFLFFFFCRKSLAAGFHFRGTNWSYSAVYAITWSPVIDCVPTNCRGCNELITSPADNRRDGQMVKSSNHRPPPGQGFRTQGSRNGKIARRFFFFSTKNAIPSLVVSQVY